MRIDHTPTSGKYVCLECGKPGRSHRVEHVPKGDPCTACGLPWENHRMRDRSNRKRNMGYWRRKRQRDSGRERSQARGPSSECYQYVGIDGEGHGREKHRYVLLGANVEDGEGWTVENPDGLTTKECLEFILNLPLRSERKRVFAYAFNYDLTKMLEDLDDRTLFFLFRPELRQRRGRAAKMGPKPVYWEGYSLNLQGTKFTVSKGGRRVVIWDLFKFYQARFTQALKDWKVGDPKVLERMQKMKDDRAYFDRLLKEGKITIADIRKYCLEECDYLATLGRKLIQAHEEAGLQLKSFYGAGSSGAAILNKLNILEKIRPAPKEMSHAVASAFFGGRFENSRIGSIQNPRIWNYDISSAYPYQTCFLSCLVHGTWRLTRKRREIDGRSLVRYSLTHNDCARHWAPFPFRLADGSICFPSESGGGWIWGAEYLEGEALYPESVEFREAWVYQSECDCRPFARIPHFYRERCRLGKEGPGIVLKLGPNSVYGKLAQSVGSSPFQSWIWAGMITSGTRAQILRLFRAHDDLRSILMVATDGIMSLQEVTCPIPSDTGTWDCTKDGKSIPLGGWEKDLITKGVFLARPGIYFPLDPQPEELKKVRARGVGKTSVLEQWRKIVESYESFGIGKTVQLANISRFCGAKTSIHARTNGTFSRASGRSSSVSYGQWITRQVEMSFDPMPKRERVIRGNYLKVRRMPRDLVSVAYDRATMSEETLAMQALKQELLEQPDTDMIDYEVSA